MSAQNERVVSIGHIRKSGCLSENPDEQIGFVRKFINIGFTYIYVHSAASDQIAFIKAYGKDVLPALKET